MIAEEHYTSANTLFNQLEHWDEVIRLQLEKAGIYEFQFKRMILFYLLKKKRDLVSNSIQVWLALFLRYVSFSLSWTVIFLQKKLCLL